LEPPKKREEVKLIDFIDARNLELNLRRYPNQCERWIAEFEHCEVIQGGCLVGLYGNGHTPEEAIQDYIRNIAGKRIAQNAMTDRRSEFEVPKVLTYP
jgi:hypothetical protein